MQDSALLTQYVQNNSEAAFSQLLARHLPLVLRTCRRELASESLAEDAAQVVFLLLARKAHTLRAGPSLAGWLYQTSVFVAKDIRKQEARRKHRQEAVMQETIHAQTAPASEWNTIEPHLNAALSALKPADRDAVLLRFLEGHTLAETGHLLGISEDAARMRVSRALEKLRRYLTAHGAAVTGVVLAALLTTEAARPLPADAASAVTQGTLQALANGPTPNVLLLSRGVSHTMKIIKIKYAALSGLVLLAGASVPSLVYAFSPHKLKAPLFTASPAPMKAAQTVVNQIKSAPVPSETQPLKIEDVRITGNKIVPARAILAAFDIHAGDQVSEKQLQHSLLHVYNLHWFNLVGPFQLETEADGGYLLTLPVRETPGLENAKPEEFQEQAEIEAAYTTAEEALQDHQPDQFAAMFTPNFRAISVSGQRVDLTHYLAQVDGPLGPASLIELHHFLTSTHRSGNLVVVSTDVVWYRWIRLPGSPDTGCEQLEQTVNDDWHQSDKGWVLETRRATSKVKTEQNPARLIHMLRNEALHPVG